MAAMAAESTCSCDSNAVEGRAEGACLCPEEDGFDEAEAAVEGRPVCSTSSAWQSSGKAFAGSTSHPCEARQCIQSVRRTSNKSNSAFNPHEPRNFMPDKVRATKLLPSALSYLIVTVTRR